MNKINLPLIAVPNPAEAIESAKQSIDRFYHLVQDGQASALELKLLEVSLTKLAKHIKDLPDFKDEVLTEMKGSKAYHRGFDFSHSETARYSYTNTPEWVALKDRMDKIQNKAQELYKEGKEKGAYLFEDTGEVVEVYAAIPSYSDRFAVKPKKQ